jgi:hypothetical protein
MCICLITSDTTGETSCGYKVIIQRHACVHEDVEPQLPNVYEFYPHMWSKKSCLGFLLALVHESTNRILATEMVRPQHMPLKIWHGFACLGFTIMFTIIDKQCNFCVSVIF